MLQPVEGAAGSAGSSQGSGGGGGGWLGWLTGGGGGGDKPPAAVRCRSRCSRLLRRVLAEMGANWRKSWYKGWIRRLLPWLPQPIRLSEVRVAAHPAGSATVVSACVASQGLHDCNPLVPHAVRVHTICDCHELVKLWVCVPDILLSGVQTATTDLGSDSYGASSEPQFR